MPIENEENPIEEINDPVVPATVKSSAKTIRNYDDKRVKDLEIKNSALENIVGDLKKELGGMSEMFNSTRLVPSPSGDKKRSLWDDICTSYSDWSKSCNPFASASDSETKK